MRAAGLPGTRVRQARAGRTQLAHASDGSDQTPGAHLLSNQVGAFHHSPQLRFGRRPRVGKQAAVAGQMDPLGRHVLERLADAGRDFLGRLNQVVLVANYPEPQVLVGPGRLPQFELCVWVAGLSEGPVERVNLQVLHVWEHRLVWSQAARSGGATMAAMPD